MYLTIYITAYAWFSGLDIVQCIWAYDHWHPWTKWTDCSVSCAQNGVKVRMRKCQHDINKIRNSTCQANKEIEHKRCSHKYGCPDDSFTEWTKWAPCSRSCGIGIQGRRRSCYWPEGCAGDLSERRPCTSTTRCKSNALWDAWTQWSLCDFACGPGQKVRFRKCFPGKYGGDLHCTGDTIQKRPCENQPKCNVSAGSWNMKQAIAWSTCSRSCGIGYATGHRSCDTYTGLTLKDRAVCWGNKSVIAISKECRIKECPHYTEWTEWSVFTPCSVTCGGKGTRHSRRHCKQVQSGSRTCLTGSEHRNETCTAEKCSQATWGAWSKWSNCSAKCGYGIKTKERACWEGKDGKSDCIGDDTVKKRCINHHCKGWSFWTNWDACPVTCGHGFRSRFRKCENNNKTYCEGDPEQQDDCHEKPCPYIGNFGKWSSWALCSKTCGKGLTNRQRTCNNTKKYGCEGPGEETKSCLLEECQSWGEWDEWTQCSLSCGSGTKVRKRQCISVDANENKCEGERSLARICNKSPCSGEARMSKSKKSITIAAGVGVPIALLMFGGIFYFIIRKRKLASNNKENKDGTDPAENDDDPVNSTLEGDKEDTADKSIACENSVNNTQSSQKDDKLKSRRKKRKKKDDDPLASIMSESVKDDIKDKSNQDVCENSVKKTRSILKNAKSMSKRKKSKK